MFVCVNAVHTIGDAKLAPLDKKALVSTAHFLRSNFTLTRNAVERPFIYEHASSFINDKIHTLGDYLIRLQVHLFASFVVVERVCDRLDTGSRCVVLENLAHPV